MGELLKIVIPTWKCVEVLDISILTVFLVFRTFLSIYISSINGGIVKAIIAMDYKQFVSRVQLSHSPLTPLGLQSCYVFNPCLFRQQLS